MRDDDRGSVTIWVLVVAVGIMALTAVLVDAAGRLQAGDEAAYVAQRAARAAADRVDPVSIQSGGAPAVNVAAAVAAAYDELAAAGMAGTASITGTTVTVTATSTYAPRALGAFGYGTVTITETATARIARGITGER